jgi:hypothetical protein
MRVTPVPFTASGLLPQPTYVDATASERVTTDGSFTGTTAGHPGFTTNSDAAGTSLLTLPGAHPTTVTGPVQVAGMSASGFTKVILHNGVDATGDIIMVLVGDGTISPSYEVSAFKGLYVEVTGTGKGTVWVA